MNNDAPTGFNVTEDSLDLLDQIATTALDAVYPGWQDRDEIPVEIQKAVAQTAGAIVVEILRQSAGQEDDD